VGKQHAIFNYISQTSAKARLDKIYIDIAGGGATLPPIIAKAIENGEFDYKDASQSSVRGARYFIIIIDDYFDIDNSSF
jgi:hypothetical protein